MEGFYAMPRIVEQGDSSLMGEKSRQTIESAARTLDIQIEGLQALKSRLDISFSNAVDMILACQGRVILTGMGKSGLVCQKITATFASTGTPAQFLHPAEGIHGDLGVVTRKDVVVAVSFSGETEEVLRLLPSLKRIGVPLITVTGRSDSTLAREGLIHLDVSVPREACPLGLAPTASTTATLCLGDALAVALLTDRGFTAEDFALYHPGGALGKRLLLRVQDVMHLQEETPLVDVGTLVKDALFEISSKRMGITGVADEDGRLVGVFSDGDLRRLISSSPQRLLDPIEQAMTCGGATIDLHSLAVAALRKMEDATITSLFVVDDEVDDRRPCGILHLHDLLKAGVV